MNPLNFTISHKILATLATLVSLLFGGARLGVNAAQKPLVGTAERSTVVASNKEEISFDGVVEQISQNLLVVNGSSFSLNQGTKIDGNITVGDQVEVEYIQSGSDSQTALKVEVEESKAGDEDENETSLSGATTTENNGIEAQSNDESDISSDESSASANNESESITNETVSDGHDSVNVNVNKNEGNDDGHEDHD